MKETNPKDDAPISGQKFFLINMASPASERAKAPTNIFKVKFVADSIEEAREKAKEFQSLDPDFDTYVGPVGRWIPFLDNPLSVENVEYQDKVLSDMINEHRKIQKNNSEKFMERVNRETQKILQHSENQGKGKESPEDHETKVKDAITLRFKIYQISEKLKSLAEQQSQLETEYAGYSDDIKSIADKADLPAIDEVAPEQLKELDTVEQQSANSV